jgi:hypothetical protein
MRLSLRNIQSFMGSEVLIINNLPALDALSSNQVVGGSNPSGRANLRAFKSEYFRLCRNKGSLGMLRAGLGNGQSQ